MEENSDGLTPKDRASLTVDAWKKVVDVQQHFNDLELRIRNLMVTLLGAAVAALGVTSAATGSRRFGVELFGTEMSLQLPLLVASLILVAVFWGMDRLWYHRLLIGAVSEGARLEKLLDEQHVPVALGSSISKESPVQFMGYRIHSSNKIDLVYLLPITLILVGIVLSLKWWAAWIPFLVCLLLWRRWVKTLRSVCEDESGSSKPSG
jgi:hypothetical protein